MGAQLQEESGAEGPVVAAESWSAESVEGVAEMTFPGSVGEETD